MFSSQNSQVSSAANYIEECFSTYLYTGNGSTQTITNGIDESGKGAMTWIKCRSDATSHALYDTERGAGRILTTNTTGAQTTSGSGRGLSSFNSTGFSLDDDSFSGRTNQSGSTYASWTFRKQPKFFDVVTFTLNSGGDATFSHSLGSVPGSVFIKSTGITENWYVYHRSLGQSKYLNLNLTGTGGTATNIFQPTATDFTFGLGGTPGATYVAYLFAHDAGGFGLTGTDNVISCGSYTEGAAGTEQTINLGYEAQWLLIKPASISGSWYIYDVMRGFSQTLDAYLLANSANAEATTTSYLFKPASTGFIAPGDLFTPGTNVIYIAIRRGPMKVPTSGTSVFSNNLETSSTNPQTLTTGFPVDLSINTLKNVNSTIRYVLDRLRGSSVSSGVFLQTNGTNAETATSGLGFQNNTGLDDNGWWNTNGAIFWSFGRAPSFFDEVCWTGTGSGSQAITHNLGVAPEFTITKRRSGTGNWSCFPVMFGVNTGIYLDSTAALQTNAALHPTLPTATTYYTNDASWGDENIGGTFVTYLFASCAGVSKVGSYTGNGSTQTINCGFTGGARFVLIKRTDSTGDWYTYDTARGMTTLTDPYLLLNSTAAESATLGSVTTVSTGFALNAGILAAINTNGASYIFLAIA